MSRREAFEDRVQLLKDLWRTSEGQSIPEMGPRLRDPNVNGILEDFDTSAWRQPVGSDGWLRDFTSLAP